MANMIPEKERKDLLTLFSGDANSRSAAYKLFESDQMRGLLKGESGAALYVEIIKIADEAKAPLDEVRSHFKPLVDKKLLDAYVANSFMDGLQQMVDKKLEERRAQKEGPQVLMRTLNTIPRYKFLNVLSNPRNLDDFYAFMEKEHMRATLRGEMGIAVYEEIMEIAVEAGAPLAELRSRIIPLLDQERWSAFIKQRANENLIDGAPQGVPDKRVETLKAETEESQPTHDAFAGVYKAVPEKENKPGKKKKRGLFERFFSLK